MLNQKQREQQFHKNLTLKQDHSDGRVPMYLFKKVGHFDGRAPEQVDEVNLSRFDGCASIDLHKNIP